LKREKLSNYLKNLSLLIKQANTSILRIRTFGKIEFKLNFKKRGNDGFALDKEIEPIEGFN
jgi:hypothetical protein